MNILNKIKKLISDTNWIVILILLSLIITELSKYDSFHSNYIAFGKVLEIIALGAVCFFLIYKYRKEKELKEEFYLEKNKLDLLVKSMKVGMTVRDKEYNILYENPIVLDIFGDQRGKKCYKVFAGLDEICEGCPVEKSFEDGGSYTLEKKAVLPSGEITYWENSSYPIKNSAGEIVSCIEVNRNVTEQKRIEEELRSNKERLQAVFDTAPNSIFEFGLDGRYIMVNKSFQLLSGYSRDELLKMHFWEMIEPMDEKGYLKKYIDLLVKREPPPTPYFNKFMCKDGKVIDVQVDWTYKRDKDRNVEGFVCILVDITERKYAEEMLLKAKQAAESANIAKSQFLANMSHEIRTPLNGIIGMTEILLESELNQGQKEFLSLVSKSADQLKSVINDILDFSKIEAGKLIITNNVFRLKKCLDDIKLILSHSAEEKGLKLSFDISPEIPEYLLSDEGRIKQIITNIVSNAIKFSKKGVINLHVEKESESGKEISLLFKISDSGIGISKEKQESIFEPFVQADGSMTRIHGGTGLGLAISKQLVEIMGGKIWLESEVNKGSTFYFTIRCALMADDKIENITSARSINSQRAMNKSLRILVAEDSPINQEVIMMQLKKYKHYVVIANDGNEVLDALEKEPFDLILMDVQMPMMDGFEATARIRKKEEQTKKHIPIIALTAHAMKGDCERCIAAGMDAYISKPINIEILFETIGHFVI